MHIKNIKREILFLVICILAVSFGQVLLKIGVNEIGVISIEHLDFSILSKIITNKFIFIGLLFHAIIIPLWLFILLKSDVSFAYPLISLSYLLTSIIAYILLNEEITLYRWLGILIIIIGTYFIIKS